MFNDLEGEDGGADFVRFAVPDEFDFALVAKEEEAVGVRQGFAGFEVPVDIPDFVIGEFRGGALIFK